MTSNANAAMASSGNQATETLVFQADTTWSNPEVADDDASFWVKCGDAVVHKFRTGNTEMDVCSDEEEVKRVCDGPFESRNREPSLGIGARVLGARRCPLHAYDCSNMEQCGCGPSAELSSSSS